MDRCGTSQGRRSLEIISFNDNKAYAAVLLVAVPVAVACRNARYTFTVCLFEEKRQRRHSYVGLRTNS